MIIRYANHNGDMVETDHGGWVNYKDYVDSETNLAVALEDNTKLHQQLMDIKKELTYIRDWFTSKIDRLEKNVGEKETE